MHRGVGALGPGRARGLQDRLRQIAAEAEKVSVHPHPLPYTRMNFRQVMESDVEQQQGAGIAAAAVAALQTSNQAASNTAAAAAAAGVSGDAPRKDSKDAQPDAKQPPPAAVPSAGKPPPGTAAADGSKAGNAKTVSIRVEASDTNVVVDETLDIVDIDLSVEQPSLDIELPPPRDRVLYAFDGAGTFYCRHCHKIHYGYAHHCRSCFPTYELCPGCFTRLKVLDLGDKTHDHVTSSSAGTPMDGQSVAGETWTESEEGRSRASSDTSSTTVDPFEHFFWLHNKNSLTSIGALNDAKGNDFAKLLDVLFPSGEEDLTAAAQGQDNTKHAQQLDYGLMDGPTGRNVLHFACQYGQDKVVLGILMHVDTAVVNARDHSGLTPLMLASMYGRAAVVEELLYGSADTNLKCDKGYTALMLSACYNWTDITSRLLFGGAEVNTQADSNGRTALAIAALNGSAGCAKRILQERNVDVTIRDHEGYTAVLLAAARNHQSIVQLFPTSERQRLVW